MKNLKFTIVALFAVLSLNFLSCSDDDSPKPDPNPVPVEVQNINGFVYEYMKAYYYWEDKIPNIDYKREPDTYDLFEKCTYRAEDRWSFLTDDYQGLIDMLGGVSKSTGYGYRLYYRDENTSNEVIGFIEYVEPGSPGAEAGLKRGDIFYKIDDKVITDQNYQDLIYRDNFKLTLGTLNNDLTITERSPSINIEAVVWQSNPILYSDVIEYEGHKIGYLVYTSFIDDYNDELQTVFAEFKAQGVDNLVLDLRYNSGGAVSSAILMSSMIAPSGKAGEVLLRTSYNPALTSYLQGEYGDDFNIDRLQQNVSNLNLSKMYVLTTYKTASASEMVIYGLEPHLDEVIQIGEQTHGKYYGSITISDPDEKHNWAIQPIVMRAENIDNSIDYTQGLLPDVPKKDFKVAFQGQEIYPLGDINEDFLAAALTDITGVAPQGAVLKAAREIDVRPLNAEASLAHPLKYDMQYELKK
ncbi:peptidase S41 [Carboxylicivirga sediminis]|uniref:Peptidase S41 n=1 Tax=Carboxylicivirga sediminis TaxID=2006564 RepID=A0A941IWA8_9BACT|nr:S41 family peptidase [Carboxylicivirga sediminis]MBR8535050.1 peptidase S41 [Carboxylicivirga sediminis]